MSLCMACGVQNLHTRSISIEQKKDTYTMIEVCSDALGCQRRIAKNKLNIKFADPHLLAEELLSRISQND